MIGVMFFIATLLSVAICAAAGAAAVGVLIFVGGTIVSLALGSLEEQ